MSERKEKHDGGPAYPYDLWKGMSLRDYFAGQALAGLTASEAVGSKEEFARHSYEIADAMIAERKK